MKARAIAIASAHSNTVGTLELDCTAEGLCITYVDAVRVSVDGATVPFAPNQKVTVGYTNVRCARPLGSANLLEFEVPHLGVQRLLLVHFAIGSELTLQELQQRKLLWQLWTVGIAVVFASAIALAAPRLSPGVGPWVGLASGVLFASLLISVGLTAARWLTDGGRPSRFVRDMFVGELLALLPELPRDPLPLQPKPWKLPRLDGILPRTTVAIALTLAGALLAALLMFRWMIATPRDTASVTDQPVRHAEELDVNEAQNAASVAAPSVAVPAVIQAATADAATPLVITDAKPGIARVTGPCDCPRADSLLWAQPIARLSLVVLSSRRYKRHEHEHVELEFAAINNSNQDISELTSMAEFFQQDPPPSSKLVSISTRAVYYQGPLHPGEAVKWHVDAEGMTFRLHPAAEHGAPITGTIDEHGDNAAPTNSIAHLLKAHNRPVRLHGAMLLAYLGDPRAREATVELGDAMRETESSYLRRLMEALGELRVCQVQVATTGNHRRVFACVFNTTATPRTPVQVTVRALDATVSLADPVGAPPQLLAESAVILPGAIAAKAGMFSQIDVDFPSLPAAPAAYETVAQTSAAAP